MDIDEFGTYFVVRGDFAWFWRQSTSFFQPQTPLYYIFVWLFTRVAGFSEAALRFPSLVFVTVAAILFYLLAREFFDRDVATVAPLIFLCLPDIYHITVQARPYGIGLLFIVGSFLWLVRWLKTAANKNLWLYALCTCAAVNTHPTMATLPVVHFVVYGMFRDKNSEATPKKFLTALAVVGFSLLPWAQQFFYTWSRREEIVYLGEPNVQDLYFMMGHFGSTWGRPLLWAIMLFAVFTWRKNPERFKAARSKLFLFTVMAALPLLFIFIISAATDANLFSGRYFLSWNVGLALFFMVFFAEIPGATVRVFAAAIWSVSFLVSLHLQRHNDLFTKKNWPVAVGFAKEMAAGTNPIYFLDSGYIELNSLRWLTTPELIGRLTAQLDYYGIKEPVIPVPISLDRDYTHDYMKSQFDAATKTGRPLIFVSIDPRPALDNFFEQHAEVAGYKVVDHRWVNTLNVWLLVKTATRKAS